MRVFFNHASYYFSRKCDRKYKFSLVWLVEYFCQRQAHVPANVDIDLNSCLQVLENKKHHSEFSSENKLKNQISTNHSASLVLVFWHTPSERKKGCFAWPSLCERRRRERRKFERFRWCFSWNCLKQAYQANVLVHRLHVGKYTAKENFRNLVLSVRFSKKYHKPCLKADMFKRKLRFRVFGIDKT